MAAWRPPHLPTTCACRKPPTIDHSFNCSFGGFPTIRYNKLKDVTANLLSKVSSNIQPLLVKFWLTTHLMLTIKQVWISLLKDFSPQTSFHLSFFNPLAKSYVISSCYRKHENEKMSEGCVMLSMKLLFHLFSSLPVTRDLLPQLFTRLASLVSEKLYNYTIGWLCCS